MDEIVQFVGETVLLHRQTCTCSLYHSTSHLLVNGELYSRLKRMENEAYLSPSINAEIINAWRPTSSLPHDCKDGPLDVETDVLFNYYFNCYCVRHDERVAN